MPEISEDVLIADLERRLVSSHTDLAPDSVTEAIETARDHFEGSPIRDFVPLLVERRVRAQLASAQPAMTR